MFVAKVFPGLKIVKGNSPEICLNVYTCCTITIRRKLIEEKVFELNLKFKSVAVQCVRVAYTQNNNIKESSSAV